MERYLVQFREDTQLYFRTDCAFRDGQLRLARHYVSLIVASVAIVEEGQVLDSETQSCMFRYPE